MGRYLQRISLKPYSDAEVWTGWELEGRSGPLEGLVVAEDMSEQELASLGVTEFLRIPAQYLDSNDFLPRKNP
jgi:hypothetical protein